MNRNDSIITNMKPFIQDIWKKSGFSEPTHIQRKTMPLILDGKDMVAESPTGTGKTLAYLLPVLEKLDESNKALQA
ncbi:MAG TPA: DEAD/DEAH box helicase, partial [Bacillaceae bacterium]